MVLNFCKIEYVPVLIAIIRRKYKRIDFEIYFIGQGAGKESTRRMEIVNSFKKLGGYHGKISSF